MEHKHFHTLKGYEILEVKQVTYAMEDYLEMICRLCEQQDFTRINELSRMLNVKPSSVTKMVGNLRQADLVEFERYSYIRPTKEGEQLGQYLIFRHNTIYDFLCLLNDSGNELEQTEKIEHYLDRRTVENMALWLEKHKKHIE